MLGSPEEKILNGLINAVGDRQQMLAQNLVSTRIPGYERQDLDFGSLMRDLKNGTETGQSIDMDKSIEKASYTEHGTKPTYESELAELSNNQLKYVLLTRLNGHIYQHMEEATQAGRAG